MKYMAYHSVYGIRPRPDSRWHRVWMRLRGWTFVRDSGLVFLGPHLFDTRPVPLQGVPGNGPVDKSEDFERQLREGQDGSIRTVTVRWLHVVGERVVARE